MEVCTHKKWDRLSHVCIGKVAIRGAAEKGGHILKFAVVCEFCCGVVVFISCLFSVRFDGSLMMMVIKIHTHYFDVGATCEAQRT